MKSECDFTIIIVNYYTAADISKCLLSLKELDIEWKYEIIIVDNHSDYSDLINRLDTYPECDIISMESNKGYAFACNIAAQNAVSNYLLFLNPDTLFVEDCISPIIEYMNKNTFAGACAPMLLNPDMSYQSSSGPQMGIILESLEAFFMIRLYRKLWLIISKRRLMKKKPLEAGWVSGAFLLIRKDVFKQMGGFDEDFFLNYEDIELCSRLKNSGYSNLYFPALKCVHKGAVIQSKNMKSFVVNRYKSRLVFAGKHYGAVKKTVIRIIHVSGLLMRIVLLFFVLFNREVRLRFSGYLESLELYLGI